MAPKAGMEVTPNVRLIEPLGAGGMGSVWLADHLTLDTTVAVKFIADANMDDAAARERFRREASLAAKLKSPHVVQTFDHGITDDGVPFIVMERLEGESLAERIDRERLSLDDASLLLSQLAEVLGRAHALGIVHRDIKPPNIFLIDSGYALFAKVLDFGVARPPVSEPEQALTRSGALLGTPLYMSPEQIENPRSADARADLWAVAVVLYEALTGALPFQGDTLGGLCLAIARADPPPPTTIVPTLPPHLDDFFARCFHPDAAARHADVAAMAEAFGASLGSNRPGAAPAALDETAPATGDESVPATRDRSAATGDENAGTGAEPSDEAEAAGGKAQPTTANAFANTVGEAKPSRRWPVALLAALAGAAVTGVVVWAVDWRDQTPGAVDAPATNAPRATSLPANDDMREAPPSAQVSAPDAPGDDDGVAVAEPSATTAVPGPMHPPPSSPPAPAQEVSEARQKNLAVARVKILSCWRTNEGAYASKPAQLTATLPVSKGGIVGKLSLSGAEEHTKFLRCARTQLNNTSFGYGEPTTLTLSVSLPAADP